jgi:hypothetical protein
MDFIDSLGSLAQHAEGWQHGEAGILLHLRQSLHHSKLEAEVLSLVEIGAGDGESLPLSIGLCIEHNRYDNVILYELDDARRSKLAAKYPEADCLGAYDPANPSHYDNTPAVMVIDTDGEDLAIMRSVLRSGIMPAVLMVEHYDLAAPHWGPQADVEPPPWLAGMYIHDGKQGWCIQAPLPAVAAEARLHGYALCGYTRWNSIWISRQHPLWKVQK